MITPLPPPLTVGTENTDGGTRRLGDSRDTFRLRLQKRWTGFGGLQSISPGMLVAHNERPTHQADDYPCKNTVKTAVCLDHRVSRGCRQKS